MCVDNTCWSDYLQEDRVSLNARIQFAKILLSISPLTDLHATDSHQPKVVVQIYNTSCRYCFCSQSNCIGRQPRQHAHLSLSFFIFCKFYQSYFLHQIILYFHVTDFYDLKNLNESRNKHLYVFPRFPALLRILSHEHVFLKGQAVA